MNGWERRTVKSLWRRTPWIRSRVLLSTSVKSGITDPGTRKNYYVFSKMVTCSKRIGWNTLKRWFFICFVITNYMWLGKRWKKMDNIDPILWRKCSTTMYVSPSVVGIMIKKYLLRFVTSFTQLFQSITNFPRVCVVLVGAFYIRYYGILKKCVVGTCKIFRSRQDKSSSVCERSHPAIWLIKNEKIRCLVLWINKIKMFPCVSKGNKQGMCMIRIIIF